MSAFFMFAHRHTHKREKNIMKGRRQGGGEIFQRCKVETRGKKRFDLHPRNHFILELRRGIFRNEKQTQRAANERQTGAEPKRDEGGQG